jgi:hypothetical protein
LLEDPAIKYERDAQQYLKDVGDSISFDVRRGIYAPNSYHKKGKSRLWKNEFAKWLTILVNAITLYFIIRYTHYARKQWIEAHTTADQAIIAAGAAKSAAGTADAALKDSQKSFVINERPYIVVDGSPQFAEPPAANAPIHVNITVRNIGKTPAIKILQNYKLTKYISSSRDAKGIKQYRDFMISTFNELVKKSKAQRSELESLANFHAEQDVAPNTPVWSTNVDVVVLSPSEFITMQASDKVVLIYMGLISYTDMSGGKYETEYCTMYWGNQPTTWHICDNHNIIQ